MTEGNKGRDLQLVDQHSPTSATYRWTPTVRNLAAHRKMSSDTVQLGGSHWRVLLLKGVGDDVNGLTVFIENVDKHDAGRWEITVEAITKGRPIREKVEHEFDAENPIKSLPQFLPAPDLPHAAPDGILTLEVLLVHKHTIAEVAQDVKAEIQNGLQSALGWFGKAKAAVQNAGNKVAKSIQIDKAVQALKALEDSDVPEQKGSVVPWQQPPQQWVGREKEWEMLIKGIVEDEGTFIFGVERGLTREENHTLRMQGITIDFQFPDEDVTATINPIVLEYKPLAEMRYKLVPKWLKEELFWRNYLWKARELGKLSNTQLQARLVLEVLNSQRHDMPAGSAPSIKAVPRAAVDPEERKAKLDSILGVVGEKEENRQAGEEHARRQGNVLQLYEEGEEALKLLKECLASPDEDMLEHMQVAHDACARCRSKLQREIDHAAYQGGDTTTAFSKLLSLVSSIDDALAEYTALAEQKESAEGKSEPQPTSPQPPAGLPSSPTHGSEAGSSGTGSYIHVTPSTRSPKAEQDEDSHRDQQASVPPASTSPKKDDKKTSGFTALPWDEDDEE